MNDEHTLSDGERRGRPDDDMCLRTVCMSEVYAGWTPEQRQRLVVAAEAAYRRGFTQGAFSVAERVSDVQVDKWLDEPLYKWRYGDCSKFVQPPELPKG